MVQIIDEGKKVVFNRQRFSLIIENEGVQFLSKSKNDVKIANRQELRHLSINPLSLNLGQCLLRQEL